MTGLRAEALAALRGWHPPDAGQSQLRDRYVAHLEARPDGLSRDAYPAHVTAGALVLSADHTHALLTLHAKARRWFHLGGHCEPGDLTLAGAALREATEESGIEGLVLDPQPLQLDAHGVDFCGPHSRLHHLDVRYLAVAPANATHAVSDESLDVRWWPLDQLPTDEPGMGVLVDLAVARAGSQSSA